MSDLSIRSHQPGDEHETAELFNRYTACFVGPFAVTPEAWLAQYHRTWRSPGLEQDPECVRVAVREGRIVGHSAADYDAGETVILQELCVAEERDAAELAQALIADVEARCLARGKTTLLLHLSHEDGLVTRVAEQMGYEFTRSTGVFMAAVTNLEQFLREIEAELTRRLAESVCRDWTGSIALRSGEMAAGLYLHDAQVEVATVSGPTVTAEIDPGLLPLLLLGRITVGEAYLQDQLTLRAEDRLQALRVLDALFPRTAMYLPRAQWW